MSNHFTRAPHSEPHLGASVPAPNAALLIDFDNVTMGMRSDLAKELKSLLNSDIIKGKVTVQRAYADWRRYPQYIVPLSEASIDLIFAPAYGSSKKNATDIRMAIDGMELVFIRPEIGTYILLTGDSDFSSLVLKLKEYGKYVIGIGIQESSSDILVQNCDEYYSYTSLAGLRKTTDLDTGSLDPWECVSEAVSRMKERGDVMRSDRLKQVMLELSPNFDERNLGFRKFSKFLQEAQGKGLLSLQRGENGQYEIGPSSSRGGSSGNGGGGSFRGRGGRGRGRSDHGEKGDRGGDQGRRERRPPDGDNPPRTASEQEVAGGLQTLRRSMEQLRSDGRSSVRDSDVKRKILALDPDFDEGPMGFGKFSRFLGYAEEQGVVTLTRLEAGNYEVSLAGGGAPASGPSPDDRSAAPPAGEQPPAEASPAESQARAPSTEPDVSGTDEADDEPSRGFGLRGLLGRLGPRRGDRGRRSEPEEPIKIDPAQTRTPPSTGAAPQRQEPPQRKPGDAREIDTRALGLPSTTESMVSYLANRYRGVGQKTAESLVDAFDKDLFTVLQNEPDRVRSLVGESRAEQVLAAWQEDYERRSQRVADELATAGAEGG